MKKALLNSIFLAALLINTSCNSTSKNASEGSSDTASVLDTTRLNTSLDTAAVLDVKGDSASRTTNASQYQESNGKQASRTNVGEDTTGKQAHDKAPSKNLKGH